MLPRFALRQLVERGWRLVVIAKLKQRNAPKIPNETGFFSVAKRAEFSRG